MWEVIWNADETMILTRAWVPALVYVWDAYTGQQIHVFEHPDSAILGSVWNEAGTQILTWGRDDGIVKVWDADSGDVMLSLHHPDADYLYYAAWNTQEDRILTAYTIIDCCDRVSVWDVNDSTQPMLLGWDGEMDKLSEVIWHPDGRQVVTFSRYPGLEGDPVWDLSGATPTITQWLIADSIGWWRVADAEWNRDVTHLWGILWNSDPDPDLFVIWDFESAERIHYHSIPSQYSVDRVATWSQDGWRVLVWGDDVRIIEIVQ